MPPGEKGCEHSFFLRAHNGSSNRRILLLFCETCASFATAPICCGVFDVVKGLRFLEADVFQVTTLPLNSALSLERIGVSAVSLGLL